MKVQSLVFRCSCGGQVQPVLLYVTEDYAMFLEGICFSCSCKCSVHTPLSELRQMAMRLNKGKPIQPLLLEASNVQQFTDEDLSFLKDLNVGDEDAPEAA